MKKCFAIAAALLALVSCQSLKEEFQPVFTGQYDAPEAYNYYTDADFGGNIITIAQLAAQYSPENPFEMPGTKESARKALAGKYIKGRVSTTDQPGNFYKSLYIQDGTGGMEIKIGKNGLYNDYLQGQTLYVKLDGMWLGMYGYKTGNYGGMGMVQIGFKDSTGQYETSYLEVPMLIEKHILRGDPSDISVPEPVVLASASLLPNPQSDTQKSDPNIGSLVTLRGLQYAGETFVLLYIDSNKDKTSYSNRIFLSDTNGNGKWPDLAHNITTWAMSKSKMTEHLNAGDWDDARVGSGSTYLQVKDAATGAMRDCTVADYGYDGIEKAAYSVSQYFKMSGTEVQVRTSGYCKFCDYEIPSDVLQGRKIDVTGILTLYQGSIQFVVNSAADFVYSDSGKPLYE